MYIYLSHTYTIIYNSMYYPKLIYMQVHKTPVCSHSSVDTHTGSVENMIIVCELWLHALGGGGNVQQLYTCVRQSTK